MCHYEASAACDDELIGLIRCIGAGNHLKPAGTGLENTALTGLYETERFPVSFLLLLFWNIGGGYKHTDSLLLHKAVT